MTTIELTLPDALAKQALDAGLLTPQVIEQLLEDALRRRQAIDELLQIPGRLAQQGVAPMTMDEINAEVKASRAERRRREAGR